MSVSALKAELATLTKAKEDLRETLRKDVDALYAKKLSEKEIIEQYTQLKAATEKQVEQATKDIDAKRAAVHAAKKPASH